MFGDVRRFLAYLFLALEEDDDRIPSDIIEKIIGVVDMTRIFQEAPNPTRRRLKKYLDSDPAEKVRMRDADEKDETIGEFSDILSQLVCWGYFEECLTLCEENKIVELLEES